MIYGNDPELINARCSRYAYGVAYCRQFRKGDPDANKFWHEEYECDFTDNVFQMFVDKDQQVCASDLAVVMGPPDLGELKPCST